MIILKIIAWYAVVVLVIGLITGLAHVLGLKKVKESGIALLKAHDIHSCAWWKGLLYPFGLSSKPTGREMISSYIGYAAYNGHRWAKIAEAIIDWVAIHLGDKPRHCYRAFKHYELLDD